MNIQCRLRLEDGTIIDEPQRVEAIVRSGIKTRSLEEVQELLRNTQLTTNDLSEIELKVLGTLEITDPLAFFIGRDEIFLREQPEMVIDLHPGYGNHPRGLYEIQGFAVNVVGGAPVVLGLRVSAYVDMNDAESIRTVDAYLSYTPSMLTDKNRANFLAKREILLEALKQQIISRIQTVIHE